jgi:hypothetical protein
MSDTIRERRMNQCPVTVWTEEWRAAGKIITDDAIDTVLATIAKDLKSGSRADGSDRLRPSGIGNPCGRAQVFSYLGIQQGPKNPEYEEMADAGSWLHYKWQLEGVSAQWLTDIEVPVEIPEWGLRGAMDGLCIDGSVLELKTVGTAKYQGLRKAPPVEVWAGPNEEHLRQVYAYMHAVDSRAASIVYIDRDSNAFREFRVEWDQSYFDAMNETILGLVGHIERKELPVIMPGCRAVMDGTADSRQKSKFNFCDYRNTCETATWGGK